MIRKFHKLNFRGLLKNVRGLSKIRDKENRQTMERVVAVN